MRKRSGSMWVVLAVCAAVLLGTLAGLGQQSAQTTGSLSGRVTDRTTGKPIEKAAVSLARYRKPGDNNPPEPAAIRAIQAAGNRGGGDIPDAVLRINPGFLGTVETASDGSFRFAGLAPGDYTLSVTIDHYLPQQYGQRAPGGRGRVLTLREGEAVSGAEFQLTRTEAVAGTVVAADGTPLARFAVQAYRRRSSETRGGLYVDLDGAANTVTDAQGRYRLEDLVPGDYYVAALPQATLNAPRGVGAAPVVSTTGDSSLPEYYPGTTELETAATVKVSAASDVSGINFTVRPIKAAAVSGVIRLPAADANGNPIGQGAGQPVQAGVALVRLGLRIGTLAPVTVSTGPDGSFQFTNIIPGRYQIVAAAREGDRRLTTVREILVQAGDTPPLTLDLQRGFDVSGRLGAASPAPAGFRPELARMSITSRENFPSSLGGVFLAGSIRAEVSASGDFVFRNVMPDVRYGIGFTPDASLGGFLHTARYGDRDLWKEAVFEKGDKKIEAVYAFAVPRIEITVMDQGKPQPGIQTVLAHKRRDSVGAYLSGVSDAQGKVVFSDFSLALIQEFDLFALEDVWKDSWLVRGFWDQFEGQGRPIRVDKGGTIVETIQVIKVERGLK